MKTIADCMSHPVITVGPTMCLAEAAEEMAARHVHHLVVMRDQRPVGILSDGDIYRLRSEKHVDPEVLTVGEAMSHDVFFVTPATRLADVAAEMAARAIGSAVVMQDAVPVGIFTRTDALRELSASS